MKNVPERIYLQVGEMTDEEFREIDFHDLDEVTWCEDKVSKTDIEFRRNEDSKYRDLLVSILSTIAESADMTEAQDGLDYGTGYFPHFRFEPSFEFTDEDMTLIKQLEDDEGEDWSTITDFKMIDE
jgi:hypothetical protein